MGHFNTPVAIRILNFSSNPKSNTYRQGRHQGNKELKRVSVWTHERGIKEKGSRKEGRKEKSIASCGLMKNYAHT